MQRVIEHRLHSGCLHHVSNGIYAVGRRSRRHMVLDGGGARMREGAVLSHRSAAALWSIGHEERGRIDVGIRRRSRLERHGIKAHCRPSLPGPSLTRWHGIPVTDPVQTLIDLAP
jgi:hypothetical protein